MKSKVILYYKSLVNQNKNFIMDNLSGSSTIETYLATLTKTEINNFQYIKQQLSLSIKVNMNQANLEMVDSKDLNYISITNFNDESTPVVNEKTYYYFIINKIWRGKDTIELVLAMDTLNSFRYNYDYLINSKTMIKRMHKNRWEMQADEGHEVEGNSTDSTKYTHQGYPAYRFRILLGDGYITEDEVRDWEYPHYELTNIPEGIREIDSWWLTYYSGGKTYIDFIFVLDYEPSPEEPLECKYYTGYYLYYLYPIIDLYSENISPVLYKEELGTLYQPVAQSWNLIYRNSEIDAEDQNNVVDCYCCPDYSIPVKFNSSGVITYNELEDGQSYLVSGSDLKDYLASVTRNGIVILNPYNIQFSFKDFNNNLIEGYSTYAVYTDRGAIFNKIVDARVFVINRTGMAINLTIFDIQGEYYSTGDLATNGLRVMRTAVYNNISDFKLLNSAEDVYMYKFTNYDINIFKQASNFTFHDDNEVSFPLKGIIDVDRVDPQLIKIIKLPYSPFNYTITENTSEMNLPEGWNTDGASETLKLLDMNTKFITKVETEVVSPIYEALKPRDYSSINVNGARNINFETKLFHSDYYQPKFVYDSFGFIFELEKMNVYDYIDYIKEKGNNYFEFTFVMTSTINSKWLFKFDWYYLNYSHEDYDNILSVARNNEVTIYNSAYITYLRTAYRYDLKTLERGRQNTTIGLVGNILGGTLSAGLGVASGNPAVAVQSVMGATTSLVGNITSALNNLAQQEQNLEAKRVGLQNQAVSTSGSDDLDLLESYSNNKAKLVLYKASEKMRKALFDLFYYAGYTINEQGIPEAYSRYWFNFVSAELIIEESSNLPNDIEDDIKEKFSQGVTFMHYHAGSVKYDLKQEKENWETEFVSN